MHPKTSSAKWQPRERWVKTTALSYVWDALLPSNATWHPLIRMWLITLASQWARWRLESPVSGLFTQMFNHVQIKENIKAPRHWPLCGEFTGDRWIPRTEGQKRGKCFHLMTSSCQPDKNINIQMIEVAAQFAFREHFIRLFHHNINNTAYDLRHRKYRHPKYSGHSNF